MLAASLFFMALFLGGCQEPQLVGDEYYFTQTDEVLLEQAQTALAKKNYGLAIRILEVHETLYPLSAENVLVEKLLIESYYRQEEYPMLKAAADRFLYEHPQDKHASYVRFLRFLTTYKEAKGYPYDWIPIDYAKRDVSRFKECFIEGNKYLKDYKDSPYAPTVAKYLPSIKEVIARYYWLQGNDLASRGQYVGAVDSYQFILQELYDTSYATQAQQELDVFKRSLVLVSDQETTSS